MPRMICNPLVCWVRPTAYTTLPTLSAVPVAPNSSATARNLSTGIPVICDTISGVYRLKCVFSCWNTQRGSCSVSSTLTNEVPAGAVPWPNPGSGASSPSSASSSRS